MILQLMENEHINNNLNYNCIIISDQVGQQVGGWT